MTDLGNLGQTSFAYAINSNGQVVGHSLINDGGNFPRFSRENGGPMIDFNTLNLRLWCDIDGGDLYQ